MLMELNAMHIVRDRPCPKGPQIYFLSERIDEKLIQPSDEHYGQLKASAQKRIEAMTAYVMGDEVCRSRQLVAYFGEETTTDCGHCDVCLRKRQNKETPDKVIEALLEKNAMTPTNLMETLDENYGDIRDTLRDMLDKGKLVLTPEGLLRLAR